MLWEYLSGRIEMGMARMDEKGRVLIPLEERLKAGLRPGVELEVTQKEEGLFLRPLVPKPVRVRSGRKWGRETFPDAGEATFGG